MGDVDSPSPKIISVMQVTELGTVYILNEIKAIVSYYKANDSYLSMDGVRLSYDAVELNVSLKEMTEGANILSFSEAKNGL